MAQKKPGKSKMTLDRLAGLVQRGFVQLREELNEKIDGVGDGLHQKVDGLRVEMQQGFSEVRQDISSLNKRVGVVEDKLDHIGKR